MTAPFGERPLSGLLPSVFGRPVSEVLADRDGEADRVALSPLVEAAKERTQTALRATESDQEPQNAGTGAGRAGEAQERTEPTWWTEAIERGGRGLHAWYSNEDWDDETGDAQAQWFDNARVVLAAAFGVPS